MFARALVVLLLILNLGIAAWTLFRPVPATATRSEAAGNVPTLRLVSEGAPPGAPPGSSGAATGGASTVLDAVRSAGAEPPRCFSLGPFEDQDRAAAAVATLRPQTLGIDVRRDVQARAWNVWLPAQAGRDEAEALAARIRASGFEDLFVVPSGADANSIALGRYGSEAAARQHAARLQSAGFPAQARAVGEAAVQFWVDVAVTAVDGEGLREAIGAGRAEAVECPSGPA